MISVSMAAETVKQFFDSLKPQIKNIDVECLDISMEPEFVQLCIEFLEQKIVPDVRIGTLETNDLRVFPYFLYIFIYCAQYVIRYLPFQ